MDFGALPPEINSTRMYAGAGAAPLMAAGATWNGLAVELSTTASSVESVIMQLTTEQWLGPASMSMVVAAQPYLAWLTYTAESAAHAAAQAMASAAAFEAAFAMTVPPAEVAANRALLAALVATNVLGQNTPAIMATEAHYGEMWAQDALAMYGYAASSAAAGRLNPLITPSQTANMAGLAGQAAAVSHAAAASTVQQVGLGSLISNLPNAVMGFASPLTSAADAAGLGGIIQDIEELESGCSAERFGIGRRRARPPSNRRDPRRLRRQDRRQRPCHRSRRGVDACDRRAALCIRAVVEPGEQVNRMS